MKKIIRLSAFVLLLLVLCGGVISNAKPSSSYTYTINGQSISSPPIYDPYTQVDSAAMGLDTAISKPTDIVVDNEGKVYIADPENGRIVILNKYWKVEKTISAFTNEHGNADRLAGPKGLYVCEDGEIYIADTGNARIIVFDEEYNFLRSYKAPESEVFEEGSSFVPVAIAVDSSKRMYVVSSSTTEGIISLNADGSFAAFIGAQKVYVNPFELFWRKFMSAEQRSEEETVVATPYNNITIDEDGFIYVTIEFNAEQSSQQVAALTSKTSDYAAVKRLNASGTDIMRRNGFFGPGGEIKTASKYTSTHKDAPTGASTIIDVALGEENTWSIFDQKRSHIYTYDKNGNLLCIYGDKGTQLGNVMRGVGIAYQDFTDDSGTHNYFLVLDADTNTIVVYERTEYGKTLINALRNTNERKYDEAAKDWEDIRQRNNNYDAAYVGIGDSLYRSGDWEGAMSYYKSAHDTDSYSDAFKQYREEFVSKAFMIVVVVIVALIVGVAVFFKVIGKYNDKVALQLGPRSFGSEISYVFHLMFHPFDGFWDLKHEKRGSVRGALFWIAMVILAFSYQSVGQGYIFTGGAPGGSVVGQILSVFVPFVLFVVANWCLTTLFDGEGSLKDIFVAGGYAIAPMSFMVIASTILTNFAVKSESTFVSLILGIGWVWVGMLLFFGIQVTHDYGISKNIVTVLATILVMAVIMFVMVLFSGLIIKMISFVTQIIQEIRLSV